MRMSRFARGMIAALVGATPIVACQSPFNGVKDAWTDQSAHPITITTHLVTNQFSVNPSDSALRQDDRDRFAALAADYLARGVGKLAITSPQGVANSAVAGQIASQMTTIANAQGVSMRDIDLAGYRAPGGAVGAPIILTYTVYDATPSSCGDWTTNYAFAPLNHVTPNHGCATQNNLSAMVENPRDLIEPRAMEPSSQGRRAVTLDKYRKGEITAGQKDDQASGTVSEVDK